MTLRVGQAQLARHGQDRALVDHALGLFGVFDGVGEFWDSGLAAQLAADVIARTCREQPPAPLDALVRGCEEADRAIGATVTGATTATVAWIVELQLHYVSVGDSRLYRQPIGGPLVQVTRDEGQGNVLDNYLGHGRPWPDTSVVRQRGTLPAEPGDRVLLVTDGVTGDFAPDLLTPEDLAAALTGPDPQAAAEALVRVARKVDDRTALVIFLG